MKWIQEPKQQITQIEEHKDTPLWIKWEAINLLEDTKSFKTNNFWVYPQTAQEVLSNILHPLLKNIWFRIISNDGYGLNNIPSNHLIKLNKNIKWDDESIIRLSEFYNTKNASFYALYVTNNDDLTIIAFNKTRFEMLKWLLFKAEYYGYINLKQYKCLDVNYIYSNNINNESDSYLKEIDNIVQALTTFVNSSDFYSAVFSSLNSTSSKMQSWRIVKDDIACMYQELQMMNLLKGYDATCDLSKIYLVLSDEGKYGVFSKKFLMGIKKDVIE